MADGRSRPTVKKPPHVESGPIRPAFARPRAGTDPGFSGNGLAFFDIISD